MSRLRRLWCRWFGHGKPLPWTLTHYDASGAPHHELMLLKCPRCTHCWTLTD